MKKSHKIIIGTGLSILALCAAVFSYINRAGFIETHVLHRVAAKLGEPVSADVLEFSIFGELELSDLKIGEDGDLLSASSAQFRFNPTSIVSGPIEIQLISFAGIRADARNKRVEAILERLKPDDPDREKRGLRIDRIAIQAERLRYDMDERSVRLEDVEIKVTDFGSDTRVEIDGELSGSLVSGGQAFSVKRMKTSAVFETETSLSGAPKTEVLLTLDLDEFQAKLADGRELKSPVSGTVDGKLLRNEDRMEFDEVSLKLKGPIALNAMVGGTIPSGDSKTGMQFEVDVQSPLAVSAITGMWTDATSTSDEVAKEKEESGSPGGGPISVSLTMKEFMYKQMTFSDFSGMIVYDSGLLRFDDVLAEFGEGDVSAEGKMDFAASDGVEFQFELSGRNIDFQPILKSYSDWHESFVFTFDGNAATLTASFHNKNKSERGHRFALDGEIGLNHFKIKHFNGRYAQTFVFLLSAMSLHVGDLDFDGGYVHYRINDGRFIMEESHMGESGLILGHEGEIDMTGEDGTRIWIWARMAEEKAKDVDQKIIDLRKLAGGGFETGRILLRGDLGSMVTMIQIIKDFVVKPAFKGTLRTLLGAVQETGEGTFKIVGTGANVSWKGLVTGKNAVVGTGKGIGKGVGKAFGFLRDLVTPGNGEDEETETKEEK